MKPRQQLVEHPFGTRKRWWAQGCFWMRGLEQVHTAFSLTVFAYNLRRVLHLIGLPRLMAALGEDRGQRVQADRSGESKRGQAYRRS